MGPRDSVEVDYEKAPKDMTQQSNPPHLPYVKKDKGTLREGLFVPTSLY